MGRSRRRFLESRLDLRTGVWRSVAVLGTFVGVAILAVPAAADPSPSPPVSSARPAVTSSEKAERIKRAKVLHDEALELYDRGEYRAAILKLEAALELDPEGRELVYNLALIHERLEELDIAEKYYRRDLEMETDPKLRERAQIILKRLEGAKKGLPTKTAASPSSSSAAAAAAAAAALPPDQRVDSRRISPLVIVATGVAGGAFLTGVGFGISALVLRPGSNARTGPDVSVGDLQDDARQAHQQAVIADVAFITAVAAAGAAVVLYYSVPPPGPPRDPPPPRAGRRVELDLAAGRAAVRVVF